ncbi:MAG: hypothetical protein LBL91_01045, partial [Lachnospiraceae bacterium]|nr:hypothetical protein [Lachnospiraceae bacterium]
MEEKNKNGFSKVLTIIFTIFSVILCNVAFKNERVIAGIIALVMTGAFIVTYLMKANVIKEPKKGINTILYIIAILLIIPYFNTYSKSQNETEKIIWSDIVMGE